MSLLGLGWAACTTTGRAEQRRIRPTQIQRKEFLAFAGLSQTTSRDLGFSRSERTMSRANYSSGCPMAWDRAFLAFVKTADDSTVQEASDTMGLPD